MLCVETLCYVVEYFWKPNAIPKKILNLVPHQPPSSSLKKIPYSRASLIIKAKTNWNVLQRKYLLIRDTYALAYFPSLFTLSFSSVSQRRVTLTLSKESHIY